MKRIRYALGGSLAAVAFVGMFSQNLTYQYIAVIVGFVLVYFYIARE